MSEEPNIQSQPGYLTTSIGWGVIHLFAKVRPGTDGQAIVNVVKEACDDDHQVITFAVFGHKADVGFLLLGPDLWRLRRVQTGLQRAGLDIVDSYVSMTELSEYAAGVPDAVKQARLYPQLPPHGKNLVCFYPMSRKREGHANWYALDFDKRTELMYEHGTSGRNFAGRIIQLVTGSSGVDDYEWGVTLFGVSLDDLKAVVYTLRFDEASAIYGDFGPFYTGLIDDVRTVVERVIP
ncbi:MAG: chlorite dismutase [Actinomycetia bacterium]|nr:chlorite dismutase [Actinomycetes bacterium]MCP4961854.1 chlorite dismutase [Actinomycetes bacterium]